MTVGWIYSNTGQMGIFIVMDEVTNW